MDIRTPDLRTAAIAEAARLAAARAIVHDKDEAAREWLANRGPWMARSRSGRRRAVLGGTLLIWQVAAEDSCGRTVASSIVGTIGDFGVRGDGRSRRRIVKDAILQIESCPPDAVAAVLREPTEQVVAIARAFADARLDRERAVAACWSEDRASPRFQPGLFDRRAERARQIAIAAVVDAGGTADARLSSAAAGAAVAPARPTLLLVLTT